MLNLTHWNIAWFQLNQSFRHSAALEFSRVAETSGIHTDFSSWTIVVLQILATRSFEMSGRGLLLRVSFQKGSQKLRSTKAPQNLIIFLEFSWPESMLKCIEQQCAAWPTKVLLKNQWNGFRLYGIPDFIVMKVVGLNSLILVVLAQKHSTDCAQSHCRKIGAIGLFQESLVAPFGFSEIFVVFSQEESFFVYAYFVCTVLKHWIMSA